MRISMARGILMGKGMRKEDRENAGLTVEWWRESSPPRVERGLLALPLVQVVDSPVQIDLPTKDPGPARPHDVLPGLNVEDKLCNPADEERKDKGEERPVAPASSHAPLIC